MIYFLFTTQLGLKSCHIILYPTLQKCILYTKKNESRRKTVLYSAKVKTEYATIFVKMLTHFKIQNTFSLLLIKFSRKIKYFSSQLDSYLLLCLQATLRYILNKTDKERFAFKNT